MFSASIPRDAVTDAILMFQFPPHRDVLCEKGRGIRMAGRALVSVPSSSGCSLRVSTRTSAPLAVSGFSSLLIGMFSARQGCWLPTRSRCQVSVPSSSGCSLRVRLVQVLQLDVVVSVPSSSGCSLRESFALAIGSMAARFSSLLIGMFSARTAPARSLCRSTIVSVPSSSGCSLRVRCGSIGLGFLDVSVPSSSGCSLRALWRPATILLFRAPR